MYPAVGQSTRMKIGPGDEGSMTSSGCTCTFHRHFIREREPPSSKKYNRKNYYKELIVKKIEILAIKHLQQRINNSSALHHNLTLEGKQNVEHSLKVCHSDS